MLPPDPTAPGGPDIPADDYGMLMRAIVSQNVSGYASRSIYRRLTDRFGGRPPEPEELRSLARHIVSGELDLERLHELPDEEVVAQLSAVKGVGVWTADMFLIFHLYRPDVLPVGDLELRRTVERVYGLSERLVPAVFVRMAEPWRPYRSLASIYLCQLTEKTPRL